MSISNEIKKTMLLLESIQSVLLSDHELDTLLEEFDVVEANKWQKSRLTRQDPTVKQARMSKHSTLGPLIMSQPGGPQLTSYLHKELGLGARASYGDPESKYGSAISGDQIKSARVMWTTIKNHPDNFIVIIGEHGVAGMRPEPGYIESRRQEAEAQGKEYDPSKDGTLPYRYAIFDENSRKYVKNPEAITGRKSKRGGLPFGSDVRNINMLDQVREQVGRIKQVWAIMPAEGRPSVEREKIAGRAAARGEGLNIAQQEKKTFQAVSPLIKRVLTQLMPKAGPNSKLIQAQKQKQLGQVINQEFVDALRNQAQASGIELDDTAAYREFLIKASRSSVELKNVLKQLQSSLV